MDKVKMIIDDIKYLENLGLEGEEILENILSVDRDIDKSILIKAFDKCGYDLTF